MLDITVWTLFGTLAGLIASKIMNTDAQTGATAKIVVGIIGAFIIRSLSGNAVDGVGISGLLTTIIGAVTLLAIVKALTDRRESIYQVSAGTV